VGRRICAMKTTIYGSTEYLARQTDCSIENHTWLMPDESLAQLPISKWLDRKYPKATVGLRCNAILGLYEAVVQGLGIAALPCFLADPDSSLSRILAPADELTSELWLLTHPDLRRTARVQALMDFLAEVLQKEKDLIEGKMLV